MTPTGRTWRAASVLLIGAAACAYDASDRWLLPPPEPMLECIEGAQRCQDDVLQRCEVGRDGPAWQEARDCVASGQVCAPALLACADCVPGAGSCDGQHALRCDPDGAGNTEVGFCDDPRRPCRDGGCMNLCAAATQERSNVGCEYWAVDLDNANVGTGLNAAAQQYAVVVSNPQPDVTAEVWVERDDSEPGQRPDVVPVANGTLAPLSLQVFRLGPREVDGSAPGTYNTGTHSALSRGAYRITSSVPIIAYQFNPLENVDVFSNDASLLKPVEALGITPGTLSASYVVLGWPQTIASTDDPDTNFNADDPIDLRAFLTIVGTRAETRVRLRSTARILGTGVRGASQALIGGHGLPEVPVGGTLEVTLDPFEVLNLETDDFGADFTGTLIDADQPIVVFSGGEASDAPFFETLADRRCCADHLEEQLDPVRTAGRAFVATVSPNRTEALSEAGADLGVVVQPEYFRVIATGELGAEVQTTLADQPVIDLAERGSFVDLESTTHFLLQSDRPVMLGSISPSQEAAGIPRGLPGGDPSFLVVPPIEQFRTSYVFLTPDKYDFDFIRIIAPPDAVIVFDNQPLDEVPHCRTAPADGLDEATRGTPTPAHVVHTCQLSFPVVTIDGESSQIEAGTQNDGVHRIESDVPVGVLVNGFDAYVSYAYAAGTELRQIAVE